MDQPTRSCDDGIDLLTKQSIALLLHWCSSVYGHRLNSKADARLGIMLLIKEGDVLLNLDDKLTSWRHHDSNRAIVNCQLFLCYDVLHHRQHVGKGLPRARLCNSHQIPPRHGNGPDLCLDRSWCIVSPRNNASLHPLRNRSFAKGNSRRRRWLWTLPFEDINESLLPQSLSLLSTALLYTIEWLIQVHLSLYQLESLPIWRL
mmetsp:Transcript_23488/g.54259  ORF Transcript_23488/g.54259 Transcript_23488/m.54259 type:complete len:203 (-) Transcript_23488:615-1223(-)